MPDKNLGSQIKTKRNISRDIFYHLPFSVYQKAAFITLAPVSLSNGKQKIFF